MKIRKIPPLDNYNFALAIPPNESKESEIKKGYFIKILNTEEGYLTNNEIDRIKINCCYEDNIENTEYKEGRWVIAKDFIKTGVYIDISLKKKYEKLLIEIYDNNQKLIGKINYN